MRLKKRLNLRKISRKGKFFFLPYDQGLEHGPTDFTDKNVSPAYIVDIAKKGKFTGLIFQKGVAEKYYHEIKKSGVPLIVKLNGKTNLVKGDPISRQLCTVEEAVALGAKAVGYTIYIGSKHERLMFQEFEDIQRAAHVKGLPVIVWMYPRGSGIKGRKKTELLAYAARVALEIGADIVKLHWDGKDAKNLAWSIKSADKVPVVIAGGSKIDEKTLLKQVRQGVNAGISGLAIGRNMWQNKNPEKLAAKLQTLFK